MQGVLCLLKAEIPASYHLVRIMEKLASKIELKGRQSRRNNEQ
jgi:hypothetical protein